MINEQKIGMVILNYNDSETVKAYYQLIKQYQSIDHIVIVDNASSDGSFDKLKGLAGGNIDVIQTNQNKGYSYGNNYGAWYLMNNYHIDILFISNPDVEYTEAFLKQIVFDMQKQHAQAATGYMKLPYHEIMTRCTYTYWQEIMECTFLLKHIIPFRGPCVNPNEGIIDVEWLPGSLFAIDANVYKELGGLDENIFLYFEEQILGKKLLDSNYKMIINTDISYFHNSAISINKSMKEVLKRKQAYKSKYYFYSTYHRIGKIKKVIMKLFFHYSIFRGKIRCYF